MKLIFATGNKNKLAEAGQILGEWCEIGTPADFGITEDIPETGDTIEANAVQKAMYVWERTHQACFADDTGLEVDSLGGAPGVYSARYAGPAKDSSANVRKLLDDIAALGAAAGKRTARFRCVIALVEGENRIKCFHGVVEGSIVPTPAGNGGFGYDPVFRPDGFEKNFSEMTADEKNRISHRGRALRQLQEYLAKR